jgi:8-hydroxy-5-deazaflavin:NADPH oxidoreductase
LLTGVIGTSVRSGTGSPVDGNHRFHRATPFPSKGKLCHHDAQEVATVKIAVLGSGVVGQTLAAKLAALGHDTMLGTRDVTALLARTEPGPMQQEPFSAWHQRHPEVALGSFAEAAAHADLVVNATSGAGSLDALRQAGGANLEGKVLVDVANPLDFSRA